MHNIGTHSRTFMTNLILVCHSPVHTYSGDELISFNQFSVFVIGAGGFGGNRTSNKAKVSTSNLPQPKSFSLRPGEIPTAACFDLIASDSRQVSLPPPKRAPDAVVTDCTTRDQVSLSARVRLRRESA